jgi:hypothetical protein
MREFQAVFDEATDALSAEPLDDVSAALGAPQAGPEAAAADSPGAARMGPGGTAFGAAEKEKKTMPSIDLGGDDLKNISYWITFDKPDFVVDLQPEMKETIDFASDEGSFGGLKIGAFFQDLAAGRVPWPALWDVTKPGRDYHKKIDTKTGKAYLKDIPLRDRKFIRITLRLNWRRPQPDAEREKDKVEVLREIRDELGKMPKKL